MAGQNLAEKFQWILTLMNTFNNLSERLVKVKEESHKKLPHFLGLSFEDERIWGSLWAQLDIGEKDEITKFLLKCKEYERNYFRYVVIGIPSSSVKKRETTTGTGKYKRTTADFTTESYSIKFLKDLAVIIKTKGAKEARNQCLVGGIISPPFSQQIIKRWKKGTKWFKENILKPLGANDISDLLAMTPAMILRKSHELDDCLADRIPALEKRGWLKDTFRFKKIFS